MAVISAFTVCMLLLADESPSERTYWTCILYVAACVLMFVAQIKASACFYLPFLVVNVRFHFEEKSLRKLLKGLHVLYGMWVLMNLVVFTIGVFRRPEDYEMLTAEGPTEVKGKFDRGGEST